MIILRKIINFFSKYDEIIRYLIFGFLTTVISLVVYYFLTFTVINPNNAVLLQVANILSWIVGVLFAYITNRKYVFRSNNKNKINELCMFSFSRIITLFIDMLIMFIGVSIFKYSDKIIKLISQIIVIISNYLFSKILVFKER